MLAYTFIGPLMVLLVPFCWKNKFLVFNLQFIRFSIPCLIQTVIWIVNIISYVLIFKGDTQVGDMGLIYCILAMNLLRSSIIAGKYATYSPRYIRRIKRKWVSMKEIAEELMLKEWFRQTDELLKLEI